MSIQTSHKIIDRLVEQLSRGPAAVLTGAGLSTASGIPAYRDADGQWQHSRPIQHQEFLRSPAVRQRYWARSFVGWSRMGHATPNRGHRALAALEEAGAVNTVITQNVDGLHQRAGSRAVVELHGAVADVICLDCAAGYRRSEVQTWLREANPEFSASIAQLDASTSPTRPDGDAHLPLDDFDHFNVPACPTCAGRLKPAVVFFGDNVPRERVAKATQAIDDAAALIVVGSSLMVWSGYRFAEQAHRQHKPVFAINRGVTRADALLAGKIEDDCGAVLEALLGKMTQDMLWETLG